MEASRKDMKINLVVELIDKRMTDAKNEKNLSPHLSDYYEGVEFGLEIAKHLINKFYFEE